MEADDRFLRPGRLATVAEHLAEAIEEFRTYGVAIEPRCRLRRIVAELRRVAEVGAYPPDEGRLSLLSEVIRTAQEFIEIANVLPPDENPVLKADLQRAVAGELTAVSSATGPHLQFQSQLWVGAMLAQSKARVGVLTRPGGAKNPDYVIENGTLRYAVEVKRPNGELDAHNIVRKAARQVRGGRYHGGMIVVDLTDCLPVSLRHQVGAGGPNLDSANNALSGMLETLHEQVFHDRSERLRNRREHVFGIYTFARVAHWDRTTLAHPYLVRLVGAVRYWRRHENTLRGHRARWLTNLVGDGIVASGHDEIAPPRRLDWSPPGTIGGEPS